MATAAKNQGNTHTQRAKKWNEKTGHKSHRVTLLALERENEVLWRKKLYFASPSRLALLMEDKTRNVKVLDPSQHLVYQEKNAYGKEKNAYWKGKNSGRGIF